MRTAANKLGCPPVGPAANIKRFVMRPDADPTFANILATGGLSVLMFTGLVTVIEILKPI